MTIFLCRYSTTSPRVAQLKKRLDIGTGAEYTYYLRRGLICHIPMKYKDYRILYRSLAIKKSLS